MRAQCVLGHGSFSDVTQQTLFVSLIFVLFFWNFLNYVVYSIRYFYVFNFFFVKSSAGALFLNESFFRVVQSVLSCVVHHRRSIDGWCLIIYFTNKHNDSLSQKAVNNVDDFRLNAGYSTKPNLMCPHFTSKYGKSNSSVWWNDYNTRRNFFFVHTGHRWFIYDYLQAVNQKIVWKTAPSGAYLHCSVLDVHHTMTFHMLWIISWKLLQIQKTTFFRRRKFFSWKLAQKHIFHSPSAQRKIVSAIFGLKIEKKPTVVK